MPDYWSITSTQGPTMWVNDIEWPDPPKTPLRELTERVWAEEDTTDGE